MTLLQQLEEHLSPAHPYQKRAWKRVVEMGLPTKRWDAFRYPSLKGLYGRTFASVGEGEVRLPKRIAGQALLLSTAQRSYGALLEKGFARSLEGECNPFALLNLALYREGLFLYVPPGEEREVELLLPSPEEGALLLPRIEIFVGKSATLRLSCRYEGGGSYFYNQHLQITLDQGARCTFEEQLEHSPEADAMHTLRASLKRDALFTFSTLSKGARCERHDLDVELLEEGSSATLKGLAIGAGSREIHHFIHVRHKAPRCISSQHYKNALMGSFRSSFEGKIFVERAAQKTEAYQLNNNLLLSQKAQAMSKPNLEIFADDVRASHGATATQPKAEELLYLRSRGLSEEEARWQLARSFCKELQEGSAVDRYLREAFR